MNVETVVVLFDRLSVVVGVLIGSWMMEVGYGFVSSLEELWVSGRVDWGRTGRMPGELVSWRRKIAQHLIGKEQ